MAVGKTLDEVRQLIAEAVAFHIEGMQAHGEVVPPPTSLAEYAEVELRDDVHHTDK